MRLGFACVWDDDAPRTWSYTPWELRAALRRRLDGHGDGARCRSVGEAQVRSDLVDVGIEIPRPARRALQLASLRRRGGRWVTPWEHLPAWERGSAAWLDRRARSLGCDVVLQIQDLGVLDTPYLVYQDFSYDLLLSVLDGDDASGLRGYFPHLDRAAIERRRARQLEVYGRAAGVLTMSRFLARSLVEDTGLDPAKVHVVPPGTGATTPADPALPALAGSLHARAVPRDRARSAGPRLLFVGTSFTVKGGDQVVAALRHLRGRPGPTPTLTVAGPDRWPGPGGIPEGVRYLGRIPAGDVSALYASHDLLVVPSRLEGFGKVFVEALAAGVPCVGRDAFAMPELIRPGDNGELVGSDDPVELADAIARVLADDGIRERCVAQAPAVAAHYSWERAAADVLAVAGGGVASTAVDARPVAPDRQRALTSLTG